MQSLHNIFRRKENKRLRTHFYISLDINSLFDIGFELHFEQWTPFAHETKVTNDETECARACELSNSSDFYVIEDSKCYCGDFDYLLGSIVDKSNPVHKINFKKESVDKYLDKKWIKIEESDQQLWSKWIYKRFVKGYGSGRRYCQFEAMYEKECDFVKFDWNTKECFLGSFHYSGSFLVTDTEQLTAETYIKKGNFIMRLMSFLKLSKH